MRCVARTLKRCRSDASASDKGKELAQAKGKAIVPAEVVALPQLLVSHNRGSMQHAPRLTAELHFLRCMDEEIVGRQTKRDQEAEQDPQRSGLSQQASCS